MAGKWRNEGRSLKGGVKITEFEAGKTIFELSIPVTNPHWFLIRLVLNRSNIHLRVHIQVAQLYQVRMTGVDEFTKSIEFMIAVSETWQDKIIEGYMTAGFLNDRNRFSDLLKRKSSGLVIPRVKVLPGTVH